MDAPRSQRRQITEEQRERYRLARQNRRRTMSTEQREILLANRRQQRQAETEQQRRRRRDRNIARRERTNTNNRQEVAGTTPPNTILMQTNMPPPFRRVPNSRRVHNSGRNYSPTRNIQRLVLPEPRSCPFCGARIFIHETFEICCAKGNLAHLPRPRAPQELINLFLDQTEIGEHFRQNIRSYNHVFAFTSMGVTIDEDLASGRNGVFSYRAQGAIYHRIGGILPIGTSRPRYLQMYIYDTAHEQEHRQRENQYVRTDILFMLRQILDAHNPFVHVFRQLGQRQDIADCRLIIKELTVDRRIHEMPTAPQVAAIVVGGDGAEGLHQRDIIVQTQSGQLQIIPDTAGYYDPLQYPLLLPFGQYGWDLNIHNSGQSSRISCRAFYSYIFQIRPTEASLFLHAGRLFQQYAVDMFVKIETMRMRYYRDHQSDFRAELYHGLQDALNNGETRAENVGRRTILPPSHVGGPRDMYHRYQNAMALVTRYGKPDLFITITCNSSWPEIQRELPVGITAQDRPDITTRIFRAKLEELKKDLFEKGVLGQVVAHVHVIEFQKRGLPHSHILLILDANDRVNNPDEYDTLVRAEIPCPETEPDLYNAVKRHMMHKPCGEMNRNAVCMKEGACKKMFPKDFAPITRQGNDSYPVYQRRDNGRRVRVGNHELDNRWVVPYNPFLLLKYDCHINVEICSTITAVKYLYKYVYKGPDRVSLGVSTRPQGDDEISQFVNARWICAPEALWRIFKFQMSSIFPTVLGLQLHLPNRQQVTFYAHEQLENIVDDQQRSKTMLTEFFTKNVNDVNARQYLYSEFPEKYWWNNRAKQWISRTTNRKAIGRLYAASPMEGERYYLRLLLNHVRGPLSFDDLLTVNGVSCSTFKESALKRGLLENDDSLKECLRDAANTHMPSALRRLFVTILVYSQPSGVRALWDEFYSYMLEDYPSTSSATLNSSFLINLCLRDLNKILIQYGKSISDFDLPQITMSFGNDSNISKLVMEELSLEIPRQDLDAIDKLNCEQKHAFNLIDASIMGGSTSIFFIDGPGGTGKTFLYRAILAHLRSQNIIAIATATSGIAALALPGGRTAHSRFKIPLSLNSTSTCNISKQSDLAQLLRYARVIIWDEATMAHRYMFEALDRTLRDITGNNELLFGGKILILGGDFRQVLPVVPQGTRAETVDACIVNSSFWHHVRVLHLKENMRAINDPFYANFLLRVGNGDEQYVQDNMIKLPDNIVVPWNGQDSLHRLIHFVFPMLIDRSHIDNEDMMKRAILAPRNETVDEINEEIISMFPGEPEFYYSFDRVEDDASNMFQPEFLNSLSSKGLPPHKLTLKVGSPIMLLRNLDTKIGLCNGTRLICRHFHRNLIDAEIAVGHFRGTRVFIPRIPLKPSDSLKMPFNLIRKQFPIKLAFSLTINKSQRQTIPYVGIFLPEHVFSHGPAICCFISRC